MRQLIEHLENLTESWERSLVVPKSRSAAPGIVEMAIGHLLKGAKNPDMAVKEIGSWIFDRLSPRFAEEL